MSAPSKYEDLDFTSSGLAFASHSRASPETIAIELGLQPRPPLLTPSGRISKKKPIASKYPKSWWEAQARLYGLECWKWTMEEIKRVLVTALRNGLRVPKELTDVEEKLKYEREVENTKFPQVKKEDTMNEESDEKWDKLNDVAKANFDAERFLREVKLRGEVKALRGLKNRFIMHRTAEMMGMYSESTDGVGGGYTNRILVVGRTCQEVRREIDRIREEIYTQQQVKEVARQREIDRKHQEILLQRNDEDVGGIWSLDMPYITDHYMRGDITLKILPPERSGQVWGSFNLLILEGVLCIHLGKEWKGKERAIIWRGMETGEGQIQFDETRQGGSITFITANTCAGTWWSTYGSWEFSGKKISMDVDVSVRELKADFEESYDEEAYECARVGRWG
jgi:hypothetical protein